MEAPEIEKKKVDDLWASSNFADLREQIELDREYITSYKFSMDKKKGSSWQNMTSPFHKALMRKTKSILKDCSINVYVTDDDDERAEREEISWTEKLCAGLSYMADKNLSNMPMGRTQLESMALYAAECGGLAVSVWLNEDEDGNIDPGRKIYDPHDIVWIEGESGIVYFAHRHMVSRQFLKDTYKNYKPTTGESGIYKTLDLVDDIWTPDSYASQCNSVYLKKEKKGDGITENPLERVPVRILAAGDYRNVGDKTESSLKYAFESAFANNRDLIEPLSEAFTVLRTRAMDSGEDIMVVGVDSEKGGEIPEGIDQAKSKVDNQGGGRFKIVTVDASKGQAAIKYLDPPTNQHVLAWLDILRELDIITSMQDPVTYGAARDLSGTAINEYKTSAQEFLKPFLKVIEAGGVFAAQETAKQYKEGTFEKVSVEGSDYKGHRFSKVEIHPDKIDDTLNFKAEAVLNSLRDRTINVGNFINEVKAGIPYKIALKENQLAQDPDFVEDMLFEEQRRKMLASDPVLVYDDMAETYMGYIIENPKTEEDRKNNEIALGKADYFKLSAQHAMFTRMKQMQQEMMPEQPQTPAGGQTPPGTTPPPQAETSRVAKEAITGQVL